MIELENKKFDRLDGFRGILAISVVLQHTYAVEEKIIPKKYKLVQHLGTYFGVPSFFVLSSFLLTYKLLDQMCESKRNFTKILLICLKYLIRRFFRIYLPFAVFCSVLSMNLFFSDKLGFSYDSLYNLVALKSSGSNHLWSCIVEIKIYFFIPFVALIANLLERVLLLLVIMIILVMYTVEKYDLFNLGCIYIPWPTVGLKNYYFIFLNGSLLALTIFTIKNSSYKFKIFEKFRFLLTPAGCIMFFYGLFMCTDDYLKNGRTACQFKFSVFWTIFMFILLMVSEKSIITLFFNFPLFKKFGKFSFGVYLLHFDILNLVRLFNNITSNRSYLIFTLELAFALFFGMGFFYAVEYPLMYIGNLIMNMLPMPTQSNEIIPSLQFKYVSSTSLSIIYFITLVFFYLLFFYYIF